MTKGRMLVFLCVFILLLVVHFLITNTSHIKLSLNTTYALAEDSYFEKETPPEPLDLFSIQNSFLSHIVFHGPRSKKEVALTFDAEMTDGMKANLLSGKVQSSYNEKIIDVLNETHTQATLFLTGMWIQLYPQVTYQLAQNPLFELGSHSYADTSFDGECYGLKQISDAQGFKDIETTQALLKSIAGVSNIYFRFPGGCYSAKDLDLVINKAQLTVVHWDVVSGDGFNPNTNQIVQHVVDSVKNGSIVVMHLNGAPTAPKTADALPIIIDNLKQKGFTFVKVSELLAN